MRSRSWRFWTQRRSDDDFAEEVESHIAMEVDRLVATGMREDDARFAARRAFGNVGLVRERLHEGPRGRWLESVSQDVRYAVRSLRNTPVFTTVAVASLAIGIGANTTMFGAIDAMMFRAPAYVRDADRVNRVFFELPKPAGGASIIQQVSYGAYLRLRDDVSGFADLAAFSDQKFSSGRGADARLLSATLVSQNFFKLLGVQPALGRVFLPTEERDDGQHVALLGYEAWQSQFAGDSAVLGRTIDVAGLPYVIVGVAPQGFTGVETDRVDVWLPLGAGKRVQSFYILDPSAQSYWLELVGRRRANATVAQVRDQATQVYLRLNSGSRYFAALPVKPHASIAPIIIGRGPTAGPEAKVSVWVGAVSLLVLLIAAANVANLLLLRGLARSRETALRLSLGATRWRVVRHALIEGMLIAFAGAICALVMAHWTAAAMRAFLLPDSVDHRVIEPRMLAFTAVVALGAGVLAAMAPALASAHGGFQPLLGAGRVADRSPRRLFAQRALIAGQVALATLLLVGAGLFVTSLRNVRAIDLGIDVDQLLYVNLTSMLRQRDWRDSSGWVSANATYRAMLERVRRVPGVANASLTVGEPFASRWALSLQRRGGPPLRTGSPVPFATAVGDAYFETMGTRLVRGRLFTASDHTPTSRVAIVDEETAKQFWPDGNAIGTCVLLGDDQACTQIVGIVANAAQYAITGAKGSYVYLPLESAWGHQAISMMEVRSTRDPDALVPAIRRAVQSVSPDLPWVDVQSVSRRLAPQLRPWRLGASMFTAFGVLALCLAAFGLYGLLSYMVAQRTHEIGVRKALGASNGGVVRLVLRGSVGLATVGIVVGVAGALGAGRLIASQLYGVTPRDPFVFAVCIAALLVVAVIACLAPARRATRVDPMVALRTE